MTLHSAESSRRQLMARHAGMLYTRVVLDGKRIDRVSMADILRQTFVTPPFTAMADVFDLAGGFMPRDDAGVHFDHEPPFPPTAVLHDHGDTQAYVDDYHHHLCASVHRAALPFRRPCLLQSGGKDSTSLAIALARERSDALCATYLAGCEEDEVASAGHVARTLGLRHRVIVGNASRAYRIYVDAVADMPLITADFALLSYLEMASELRKDNVDGILDGIGADVYFGGAHSFRLAALQRLARRWPRAGGLTSVPLIDRSFSLCYLASTLTMSPWQRHFPGSRFTDEETDTLLGEPLAAASRLRSDGFEQAIARLTPGQARVLSFTVSEPGASRAKAYCASDAVGIPVAYPFADAAFTRWARHALPGRLKHGDTGRQDKVAMRLHIARRFSDLPYVGRKGSFRFDVRALAEAHYDDVVAMAEQCRHDLPGAPAWLKENRRRRGNKFHASKFYVLAILLPWLRARQ